MSMERVELAVVFEESMYMIANDEELSRLAKESVRDTIVINDALEDINNSYKRKSEGNNISVVKGTTFDTARELVAKYDGKKKVAVLNFANAYNPGGGVIGGARAQEECLCRCSTLYKSLKAVSKTEDFYALHKMQRLFHPTELNQTGLIYTPNVAIFRSDDYTILDEPVLVDVITCAAPELFRLKCDNDTLREIHMEKARAILNIAISNNVDIIVLGAFGCGAFKNPPEIVADVYKKILHEQISDNVHSGSPEVTIDAYIKSGLTFKNCFDEVVFAIRSAGAKESENLRVFREVLTPIPDGIDVIRDDK